MGILERHAEGCFPIGKTIGKLSGKIIWVGGVDVGIPSHGGMTFWIRQRRRVFIGLDENLYPIAPTMAKNGFRSGC